MLKRSPPARQSRVYADEGVKATSHPTRQTILRSLQEAPQSTVELEKLTGENRYNLYHHLTILEAAGLVGFQIKEGRVKEFFLRREQAAVRRLYSIEKGQIPSGAFRQLVEAVDAAVQGGIPNPRKVTRLDITITAEEE